MIKHINLQLFADGDTDPGEMKEEILDNKQEKPANPFDRLTKLFNKKEPEGKEEIDAKPDDKTIEKPEDSLEKPETKEAEKEPEGYEINHLGKKVKIPAAERDAYLQMGYDYKHVKAEAENAKSTLKKIVQAEGFDTVDGYLKEIEARQRARMAEEIEEAAGDPEKINEIVENHPVVRQTREERRKIDFERAKSELRKDKFFAELEPQLDALMEQNPNSPPDLIYKILRSDYLTTDRLNEFMAKEKETAERKVINDVHDKERRSSPKGGDTGDGKNVVQPTDFTRKLSGIFGVSPQKVAQRVYEKSKRS